MYSLVKEGSSEEPVSKQTRVSRSVLVRELGSEPLGEIAPNLLMLLEAKDGVSAAVVGFIAEYVAS